MEMGKSWTLALYLPYRKEEGRSILIFISRMMEAAAQEKNLSCQICSLFRLHSFCMPVIGGIKPISCIDICRKESHAKGK